MVYATSLAKRSAFKSYAEDEETVDYTSVKVKLIQPWRYKTLAVIKRHKNHLSFYFFTYKLSILGEFKRGQRESVFLGLS